MLQDKENYSFDIAANVTVNAFEEGYKQGTKETAKKIMNDLDAFLYQCAIDYETAGHKDYFAVCEYLARQIKCNITRQYGLDTKEN